MFQGCQSETLHKPYVKKEKQMHSMPSLLYILNNKYNITESSVALE